jgi:DNA recombination protein RmuC
VTATVNNYNKFVGSLERQVLPSARKLNMLDESKVLPELVPVEEAPREVTAYELVAEITVDDDELAGFDDSIAKRLE